MKTIKKIKESSKAVAGSALLVGATLAGGAAFATASSHNMGGSSGDATLGDYPGHFIGEDGTVSSTVVMGEDAASVDVVAGAAIAGQLGNNAFTTETQTVSTSSGVAGTFTAENGITLNRQSTDLFLDDTSASGITRIDDQDVNALETATFQSADNNEVEVEHDVTVEGQEQQFTTEGDYDNPVLHLDVPTSVTSSDGEYLFSATAEFSDSIDFTVAGDSDVSSPEGDEYLEDGDELELFGTQYTFSDESDESELVFYGSSDREEVNTGETSTVTVDGNEVTLGATFVTDNEAATVTVEGSTESVEEGDSVGPNGNIRVSDIYQTGPDGEGRVAFSQGSNELVIDRGSNDVELDGESVDGVHVEFSSGLSSSSTFEALESMNFYFGAQDNDQGFIEAGEMYEDPVFGLEFHYGGVNPDVSDADNAEEAIEVEAPEDGQAEVSFTTAEGNDLTVPVHTVTEDVDDDETSFGPEDGTIAQYEGQTLQEDDMVVLNSFEEAALYQVTDVSDQDLDDNVNSEGEVSVTLENAATGDTVTLEEDGLDLSTEGDSGEDTNDDGEYVLQDESIEGKDFDITFTGSNDAVQFERSADQGTTQLWPALYTATDSAIAFDAADQDGATSGDQGINAVSVFNPQDGDFSAMDMGINGGNGVDPSTDSGTNTADTEVIVSDTSGSATELESGEVALYDSEMNELASATPADLGGDDQVTLDVGDNVVSIVAIEGVDGDEEAEIVVDSGQGSETHTSDFNDADTTAEFTAEIPSGVVSNDATATVTFDGTSSVSDVSVDSSFVQYGLEANGNYIDLADRSDEDTDTGILLAQPENDDDEEEAYVFEAESEGSGTVDVAAYTGFRFNERTLDEEDIDVSYDEFGAYTADDEESSDSETLNLHMPSGQGTVGMAFTGADGELMAGGSTGGGSDTVETQTPTGFSNQYTALDSDSSVSSAKQNRHLVLVGGPAVNSVVGELVEANETMAGSEYTEGQGMLQLVEDAFSEGHDALIVAGHSGEDTRAAGEFLVNHDENSDALEGADEVTINTAEGTVVQ